MNTKLLSIFAIGLWLLTALVAATMFVKGTTGQGSDGRIAIYVNQSERNMILVEMRQFLNSVQLVLEGINAGNLSQVKEYAKVSGSSEIEGVPPALMGKLPIQFKQWGRVAHSDFDELVSAIDQGESKEQLQERVASLLKGCIQCHKKFRLDLEMSK